MTFACVQASYFSFTRISSHSTKLTILNGYLISIFLVPNLVKKLHFIKSEMSLPFMVGDSYSRVAEGSSLP